MKLKEFYIKEYPTDQEIAQGMNPNLTFLDLYHVLIKGKGKCLYDIINVHDSVVRERLFEKLSSLLNESYSYVYDLWLNVDQSKAEPMYINWGD